MTRTVLYSRSGPARPRGSQDRNSRVNRPTASVETSKAKMDASKATRAEAETAESAPEAPRKPGKFSAFLKRHERPVLVSSGVAAALVAVLIGWAVLPGQHEYTQDEIDKAVQYTLEHQPKSPPSRRSPTPKSRPLLSGSPNTAMKRARRKTCGPASAPAS